MPPAKHPNFQHLLYLQALVEEQHVTRAAERMGISQPAMSTALAKLRALSHDPLLVNTSSGMEPTPRAQELVKRIREISSLLEGHSLAGESFDPGASHSRFRIMASDGITRVLLPELMERAGRLAPHMEFTVSPADGRRMAEYLRNGDFDLALVYIRNPPAELRQTMLYPQRLLCIARQGHPAVHGSVTLQQFVEQGHVAWGAPPVPPVPLATMETLVDELLEQAGHSRRIALRVSSVTLLPGIVARSDLLAVVPEQLARHAQRTLPLQLLPPPFQAPSTDVTMLWHDRAHHDPAHQWLRHTLLDIGREFGESLRAAASRA